MLFPSIILLIAKGPFQSSFVLEIVHEKYLILLMSGAKYFPRVLACSWCIKLFSLPQKWFARCKLQWVMVENYYYRLRLGIVASALIFFLSCFSLFKKSDVFNSLLPLKHRTINLLGWKTILVQHEIQSVGFSAGNTAQFCMMVVVLVNCLPCAYPAGPGLELKLIGQTVIMGKSFKSVSGS